MANKKIVLIGTLDTKGDQVGFLKNEIEEKGHTTIVIDVGVLGEPACEFTYSKHQVAEAAGLTLDEIIAMGDKGQEVKSMGKMTEGARKIIQGLVEKGDIDGLLGVGGSMGTALNLDICHVLPLAFPKIVLSTIANSPAINPDYYTHNIIMLPWIGGLWGINEVSERILKQAAALISAGAETYERKPLCSKRLIGVASLGGAAAQYLKHLRPSLEARNYEVSVFHATGMSPRLLEKAIADGSIDVALELFVGHELTMNVIGSAYGPGPNRLEAAIKRGTPMIVSHGILEVISWPSFMPLPPKLAERPHLEHNSLLWMLFTDREERFDAAKILAEKLNRSTGPVAVVLPLEPAWGVTKYGIDDPEGNTRFQGILKERLKPEVKVYEVDSSQDDPKFSDKIVSLIDEMMG
jgi:uncharacterized protein (UPF0261 family)